jgi:hypothetical protein
MRMNSKLINAATAVVAMLMMAAPASALDLCGLIGIGCPPSGTRSTPELDPSLLGGTLTVLVGGLLMLAERRRRN